MTVDPKKLKDWWSNATRKVKAAGKTVAKKAIGPVTAIEIAGDATSKLRQARVAYAKHCNGYFDNLIGKFEDAKAEVEAQADELGVKSTKQASMIVTKLKSAATGTSSWVSKLWHTWWK